jgi:hypothetical protein
MNIRLALALALGATGTIAPGVAYGQPEPDPNPVVILDPPPPAKKAPPPPADFETRTSPWNAPVFTTGAIVFAGSYGGAVVTAAASEDDTIDRGNRKLFIPIVGPWLALEARPDCPRTPNESCDNETTKKGLLVLDGVLQAGGVITMITGLLSPTEHLVRRPMTVSKKVRVSPTAGGHLGLSVYGHF